MIKAILFDCFGVLTESKWEGFVAEINPSKAPSAHDLHTAFNLGFITYNDFAEGLIELTGIERSTIDTIFKNRQNYGKNTRLLELIKELHLKYKTGVISNVGSNWIREDFLTSDEIALFDDFVLSYEVQLGKPNPEIYRMALDHLNVEPHQAVFIDDNSSYCKAAEELGMRAILYKDFIQFKRELDGILANADD